MSRAASVRQSELTRALKAAAAAGMQPSGYSIAIDGTITVNFEGHVGVPNDNSFDQIMRQAK